MNETDDFYCYCDDSKRHNTPLLNETDDFYWYRINDIQTKNYPKTKQSSVSHVTSTSTRNGQGSDYKVHKVSIQGTTAVNYQPHQTRFGRCSQLFRFKPRKIHKPTLMEFLSTKAGLQRFTGNEI